MDKHFMLIVNPVAGKNQAKGALCSLLAEFSKYGYVATVYMTTAHGDATKYAKEHGNKFGLVVCMGGDGTLSEVINGLMELDERPRLGYIPMGTTNDLASCLKLTKDVKTSVQKIVYGNTMPLDIGEFDGKYFAYVAAFGAFTEVSYITPQDTKQALGRIAYILEGMSHLSKITPIHARVEYDDGEVDGNFIFGAVTNSTRVAGIVKLDPSTVLLHDGIFEVLLIRNPGNIAQLNSIISKILTQKYDDESIVYLHSKKITFTFDNDVAWTLDGENGGKYSQITANNLKHSINIIV